MSKPSFAVMFTVFVLSASLGCGEEDTTGRRVLLHTRLVSDAQAGVPFTASSGWTVTLDRAVVAMGNLYFYDGTPPLVRERARGPARWLAALSPIRTAHAHPGHYQAGRTRGQMLMPYSVDLLAAPATLLDGDGITGIVRSATFSFAAPSAGPALAALAGHVAVVSGTATKADKTVHFLFNVDLADIEQTAKNGEVTGCAFTETTFDGDGTVTVEVKPRVWFNLVDFAELAPGAPGAPTIVARDSIAQIAFALGLTQLSAYQFSYTKP